MLSKRLIACLDVRDGKLAKSVKFVDTKDIGDPVEKAREYYADGLDELVFYDITASSDNRSIMLDVVEAVAREVFIPLSVGGGVRSVADATDLRLAGAEKINVNSAAVQRPQLIAECAEAIGAGHIFAIFRPERKPRVRRRPPQSQRADGLDRLFSWSQ